MDGHHVVVDSRQCLRLEVIPEPLGIGDDPLIQNPLPRHRRGEPAGRDPHFLVVRKDIEVRPQDPLGLEAPAVELAAVCSRSHHLVRRRADRHLLEINLLELQIRLASENLVDGVYLQQPSRGGVHGLVGPLFGRTVLGKADRQALDRFVRESRAHYVVEPAEALLVGGEHRDRRAGHRRSRLEELRPSLLFDRCADLRRLAQPGLDDDRPVPSHTGKNPRAKQVPEVVHLGGDLDILVDQSPRVLDVEIFHRHLQGVGREDLLRPFPNR